MSFISLTVYRPFFDVDFFQTPEVRISKLLISFEGMILNGQDFDFFLLFHFSIRDLEWR